MRIGFWGIAAAALLFSSVCSCDTKEPEEGPGDSSSKVNLVVMPMHLSFDCKGSVQRLVINSDSDWQLETPSWIKAEPDSGTASGKTVNISVTASSNEGDAREDVIYVKAGNLRESVKVSQEAGRTDLKGKKYLIIGNSMLYYGGFVQKGSAGSADPGMLDRILKAYGMDGTVIDCTQGGHYLSDFLSTCNTCSSHPNHLAGQDFGSFDYIILSEAGSNTKSFLSDCRALYKKVTDKNPNARKLYINHIYSVYKGHSNILGNLRTLHEQDDVTIVNCGQLAYDIYTGKVKVPGGNMTYSDRYTFCNHKGSDDTHHPNPLMGYIMTQMTFCAMTGTDADFAGYASLIKSCKFAAGSTTYDNYYSTYYTTPAAHPFMDVIDNPAEMKGIQQLIPQYINKY